MTTIKFDNAKTIAIKKWDPNRVRASYADNRGFGRDDDYIVALSDGTNLVYNSWSSPEGFENGFSRTLLFRGGKQETVDWCASNRPDLLENVCNWLDVPVPEVIEQ